MSETLRTRHARRAEHGEHADSDGAAPAALAEIRRFWDADAPTYDDATHHHPRSPAVRAAWAAALTRLLPPPPARVLDAGAGTGFLSLLAARLGHQVTALDISTQMLERLRRAARTEHLEIDVVEGDAQEPPAGFDVVMERHLLWTLPDPVGTLSAWRAAAPTGRLVLVEGLWGDADRYEALRSRLRRRIRRLQRTAPGHHASYPDDLRRVLPLGSGTAPDAVVGMVSASGWHDPRLERLRDVEWTERHELPALERLLGVTPRFSVVALAGAPAPR